MKRVIRNYVSEPSYKYNVCPLTLPLSLTEVNLTGRGTKSVILNSFQDLNFLQIIPHPFPLSYLGEGIQFIQKPTAKSL